MKMLAELALFGALLLAGLSAQPMIPPGGVLNDASSVPAGLPAGAIAPGSRFAINGSGLGPSTPVSADGFPLGTSLGGVTVVAVSSNGTVYTCYPFYVSGTLVRAMLTNSAPSGPMVIQLMYQSQTSNSSPVTVDIVAPGLYSVSTNGEGPGQVSNLASAGGQVISSTAAGGKALTTAEILATGLGAISHADTTAPPQQDIPDTTVSVTVGGVSATRILYYGRSTKQPGADQLAFQIPSGAPLGCYVPVQIVVNGVPSNLITVALSPNATVCSDAGNPGSTTLSSGGSVGLIGLMRTDTLIAGQHFIVDRGATGGILIAANPYAFNRAISLPPPGACTVYMSYGDVQLASLLFSFAGLPFDPGTLNITGPNGMMSLTGNAPALLGVQGATLTPAPGPPYLAAGNYTLQSPGNAMVGAYNVPITLGLPPVWTNAGSIASVTRSAGVTLDWSGGGTQQVLITGSAFSPASNSSATFLCLAPSGANSFTVPPAILQLLPAVQRTMTPPLGVLGIGVFASGTPASFSATGLTAGVATILSFTGQPVLYQ